MIKDTKWIFVVIGIIIIALILSKTFEKEEGILNIKLYGADGQEIQSVSSMFAIVSWK